MSSIRFGATGVTALWVLAGCGGATPVEAPAAPTAVVAPEPAPLPPLTPVAASPDLFAVARVSSAQKVADTASAWSGMPFNWRSLMEKEAPGITQVLALSSPVDLAASLDPASGEIPKVFWAFSFGVSSTDGAVSFFRQQGMPVTSSEAGAYRVTIGSDLSCVVARALGASPARVVCSDGEESVQALYPYMTRGLPVEAFGTAELHAHVLAEPFRRRYGAQVGLVRTVGVPFLLREISVDHPKLDRALHEVLYGGADELVALAADIDRLDFDIGVTPSSDALDVSVALSLGGQRSWWGATMAKAASQMTAAPELFWKLPANASSASFGTSSSAEQYRGMTLALRDLMDGALDYAKLSEPRRRALLEAFEKASVLGVITAGVRSAIATLPPPAGSSSDPLRATIGQHLAVQDNGAPMVALLSEVGKTLNDPSLRANLSKQLAIPTALLPTVRERPLAGKGIPAGARRFDLSLPRAWFDERHTFSPDEAKERAKSLGKVAPLTVTLLSVPDGAQTWFGAGTDDKALLAAIAEGRAGTGKTLATRDGLASFRTEPVISGGFASIAGFLGGLNPRLLGRRTPFAIDKVPHLGQTPILMSFTSALKGAGPTAAFRARVPRAVIEDTVALAATEIAHGR